MFLIDTVDTFIKQFWVKLFSNKFLIKYINKNNLLEVAEGTHRYTLRLFITNKYLNNNIPYNVITINKKIDLRYKNIDCF